MRSSFKVHKFVLRKLTIRRLDPMNELRCTMYIYLTRLVRSLLFPLLPRPLGRPDPELGALRLRLDGLVLRHPSVVGEFNELWL